MYPQPTADGVFMLPGANGGEEWSPIAVHPDLAYAFTVGLHQPMNYITHYAPYEKPRLWLGSAFVAIAGEAQWGNVTAVDLATGQKGRQENSHHPLMGGADA